MKNFATVSVKQFLKLCYLDWNNKDNFRLKRWQDMMFLLGLSTNDNICHRKKNIIYK